MVGKCCENAKGRVNILYDSLLFLQQKLRKRNSICRIRFQCLYGQFGRKEEKTMSKREIILEILHSIKPYVDFEQAQGILENSCLDSLEFLNLISELSTRFGVEIGVDEITAENFDTVETIEAMIERIGGK